MGFPAWAELLCNASMWAQQWQHQQSCAAGAELLWCCLHVGMARRSGGPLSNISC